MKKLTWEQLKGINFDWTGDSYTLEKYAVEVQDEFCRINGLTAEQREHGQTVAWRFITRQGYKTQWTDFDPAKDEDRRKEAELSRGRIEYAYTTPPTPPAGVPDGWVMAQDIIKLRGVAETLSRAGEVIVPILNLSAAPQPAAQTQEREAGE